MTSRQSHEQAARRIQEGIAELPEESLAAVSEFVEFLRAKALRRPESAASQPARLGGLWKAFPMDGSVLDDARRDIWSGLGRDPE